MKNQDIKFKRGTPPARRSVDAMKTFSLRMAPVVARIAVALALCATVARGATVTVAVGNGDDSFSPSSVTIHPGDTVQWTWNENGHTTTSGNSGVPNGLWDSGLRGQGATFSHTFNTAGSFPYYCTPHWSCCGMTGTVTVANSTPTPTPTPAVITNPATNVASLSATLNGSVNPHGATTTANFQYGLTTSYGSTTAMQTQTGTTVRAITANVSGLTANTTYHFRIMAHNAGGTSFGADRTFTTLTATGPPVVSTSPATLIGSFSATLNGSLDPHGLTTTVSFQYGTTTSYGSTTAIQSRSGSTYLNISANISGLMANTTYHFRIVATNSAGTRMGGDRTFTTLSATGAPVVITNPATLIASFSATLNGLLDPHGLTTSSHFQYGPTTSYGLTTAPQSHSGNTYLSIGSGISSLTANTTYHFRIVASNSSGTSMGSDKTFTTLTATGAPVVTTGSATNVTSSSATLNGSLDPHGLTTTVSFQYGTTTSYGHTTAVQSQSGNTYRNIAASISSLTTHTTYHFRIVATNSAGTRMGSDRTFTTP
jgi:trimeric autotransporter adhesin